VAPSASRSMRPSDGSGVLAVNQYDRSFRDDGVEQPAVGEAAREGVQGPAAAGEPLEPGVRPGVRGDGVEAAHDGAGAGEIAAVELDAAADGVDVRVLETGQQQAAAQVDDFGARADQRSRIVADGGDPIAADGHEADPAAGGEHGAAGEDEVGVHTTDLPASAGVGRPGRGRFGLYAGLTARMHRPRSARQAARLPGTPVQAAPAGPRKSHRTCASSGPQKNHHTDQRRIYNVVPTM